MVSGLPGVPGRNSSTASVAVLSSPYMETPSPYMAIHATDADGAYTTDRDLCCVQRDRSSQTLIWILPSNLIGYNGQKVAKAKHSTEQRRNTVQPSLQTEPHHREVIASAQVKINAQHDERGERPTVYTPFPVMIPMVLQSRRPDLIQLSIIILHHNNAFPHVHARLDRAPESKWRRRTHA